MIDDLTIAANGTFESATLGRRAATASNELGLSSMFENLLRDSASSSTGDPAARSATVEPGDEPRIPAAQDSFSREDPEDLDDYADRGSHSDDDAVSQAEREDVSNKEHRDDSADVPESDRGTDVRNGSGDAISKAETATTDTTPVIDNGQVATADRAAFVPAIAAATPLESRGAVSTGTPATATRSGTVPLVDGSLLKSISDNPQQSRSAGSAQAVPTGQTATFETVSPGQRQANGLAKTAGTGTTMQVSVSVTKESETLVSQPSFTLASAATTAGDGGRTNPRVNTKGGQADVPAGGPFHPTAAKANIQTAGAPRTPSPGTAVAGNAVQVAPGGAVPTATPGLPTTFGEALDGDSIGLTGLTNTPRGTGSAIAQAGGAGKLAPHHRPVADQISVNISKAVKAGLNRIEIRLTPESLGRVEVRLEVFSDGRVAAAVTVDNRDTLELLRSDARGLERALQDAGLKTDSGNLNFSLRGHDTAARDDDGSEPHVPATETIDDATGSEASTSSNSAYPQGGALPDGRIDIRA